MTENQKMELDKLTKEKEELLNEKEFQFKSKLTTILNKNKKLLQDKINENSDEEYIIGNISAMANGTLFRGFRFNITIEGMKNYWTISSALTWKRGDANNTYSKIEVERDFMSNKELDMDSIQKGSNYFMNIAKKYAENVKNSNTMLKLDEKSKQLVNKANNILRGVNEEFVPTYFNY